jgi:hypothetical protein
MFKKLKLLGQAIKSVKPNVPKTKKQKLKSKIKILEQQTKASAAKLKQTLFEKANPKFKGKDFTFKTKTGKTESNKEAYDRIMKENNKAIGNIVKDAFKEKKATGGRVGKMGGGMMGRRFGMKKGSKFPDLTGDGKVTFADILKGRGVINGKKKKKGEIFLTKKKSKNKNV